MVLTQDDIAAIAHIVAMTVGQLNPQGAAAATVNYKSPRVDERHFRKVGTFGGTNWKDFSFQFKAACRNSSDKAYKMLIWAEQQVQEIDANGFTELIDGKALQMSGDIFNILTTALSGEPLQMLHNCNFNRAESWRRLTKRYSPSTPLRAMQLMLQVIAPEKCKDMKQVQNNIERWEAKVLVLQRDF